ncbi:MAG TPA: MgtC/SapB family protein, partial [Anaerolineaceae bacterium]|nr:MgtC/SapB family protein [Anaerolineaceae bacterium]HRT91806.1 MgtC/SapB family protein [Anaerolineaceae bacterium]
MFIPETEILIRLGLAALLGMMVGYERERQNQPAGLRTHVILAVGSCLAMTVSIDLAIQFYPHAPNGDPARLAAQVISGIGFLGAGAILRYG